MSADLTERLACGMPLDPLVEQAAEGREHDLDEHQRDCAHCQRALGELSERWRPVNELAAHDAEVPAQLLARIMGAVRRLAATGWITLDESRLGITQARATVVSAIAETAAFETIGVASVGLVTAVEEVVKDDDAAGATTLGDGEHGGHHLLIAVEAAVRFGHHVHGVAEAIRRNVIDAITATTSVPVARVDVTVTDVRPASGPR